MTDRHALKVLGFTGSVVVSKVEVKRKFREKSKLLHPDLATGDDALFMELKEAYQTAMGISDGAKFNLNDLVCDIKQGRSLFSYVIDGQTFKFSF